MSELSSSLLIVGGCRSGKSRLAERWAKAQAPKRAYLATCAAHDEEMHIRIKEHQARRDSTWITYEESLDILPILHAPQDAGVILVDCLTLWLSNMLMREYPTEQIFHNIQSLATFLRTPSVPTVIVSNETGMGIVPAFPLARQFRDIAGQANQILAQAASTVLFCSCGLPLALKGNIPQELAAQLPLTD